jgi:hypothetical protein
LARITQAFEIYYFYQNYRLAHNLNVAVQPAAMDTAGFVKMDFRSNEAGRTALWKSLDFRAVRIRSVEPQQWQQELRR